MLKLTLHNFRRFAETDPISFSRGLTIISGPNGAGKSTLIESLCYALFGPERNSPDTLSDVAGAGEESYVECELVVDGQSLAVRRWENRAEVWLNGVQQVQAGPGSSSLATRQIRRLLGGLTRDQFEATYLAMQGDTAGLVTENGAQRRKIIEAVLQLDVLKEAVKAQQQRRNDFRAELDMKAGPAVSELGIDPKLWETCRKKRTFDTRIVAAQQFLSAVEEAVCSKQNERQSAVSKAAEKGVELEGLRSKEKSIRERIDECQRLLPDHRERERQYGEYEKPVASLDGQIQQLEQELNSLQQQIVLAEACAEAAAQAEWVTAQLGPKNARLSLLPRIESRHMGLDRARSAFQQYERDMLKYAGLDGELEEAVEKERAKRDLRDKLELDPTETEYQVWREAKSRIDVEEQSRGEALQTLETSPALSVCPTCGQAFSSHTAKRRIAHLQQWLTETLPELRANLQLQENELKRKKSEWKKNKQLAGSEWSLAWQALTTIKAKVEARSKLQEQREDLVSNLRNTTLEWDALGERRPFDPTEADRLMQEIETLEATKKNLADQVRLFGRLKEMQDDLRCKETRRDGLAQQRAVLTEARDRIGYDPAAHANVIDELQKNQRELNEWASKLTACEIEASNYRRDVETAENQERRASELLASFRHALEVSQREDKLTELLESFQTHFFGACVERVVQRTHDLVLRAVTDQSILGVRFEGDDLFYLDASHHKRPISRLSGGEKALVGLCLRIALAEQAQTILGQGRVGFLVLDEVLGALDEERREEVQRIFEDVLQRGLFQHIIMITHLDSLKHTWQAKGLEVRKIDTKTSQVCTVEWDGIEGMESQDEQPAG